MILLLSDAFQADFLNCLNRSFYFLTTSATIQIYVGEGLEVDRVLGTYLSSTIKSMFSDLLITNRGTSCYCGNCRSGPCVCLHFNYSSLIIHCYQTVFSSLHSCTISSSFLLNRYKLKCRIVKYLQID